MTSLILLSDADAQSAMQFWESATVCGDKTQVGKKKKILQTPIPVQPSCFNFDYQTMLGYSCTPCSATDEVNAVTVYFQGVACICIDI